MSFFKDFKEDLSQAVNDWYRVKTQQKQQSRITM